jgi:TetR/AcrR family transcriptional repressor of nem operon
MNSQIQAEIEKPGWPDWFIGDDQSARQKILLAAFSEIHLYGYQAASIQSIIDQAGVTKGALYHHFKSKHEMVEALIDEVYTMYVENTFIKPMLKTNDPVQALIETMVTFKDHMTDADVALGCPLDSLAQEMTPIDEGIRQKIQSLYSHKQEMMVAAFERGQAAGKVRQDISAESISLMIMATLQGCMGIAKSARSVDALVQCGEGLIHYLQQLRLNEES